MCNNFIFHNFSFISIFLIFISSVCPRSDVIREITSSTGDTNGDWRDLVYCSDNHYVYGFNQKMDCDTLGVNVFRLYCASWDHSVSSTITSHDDDEGSWQTDKYCNQGDFMQSYYVGKNGWNGGNALSLSDVRMKCITDTSYLSPGGGCNSASTSPASCNTGEAICGYQTRFQDGSVWVDDVRTTDSIFKCCCFKGYFLYTDPNTGQKTVLKQNNF